MDCRKIIVYGGRGALGSTCVNHFKRSNWWVANIDLDKNDLADANIIVSRKDNWVQQEDKVLNELAVALDGGKAHSMICVTGGWVGGSARLSRQADLMWKTSVWPATIAASAAIKYLAPGGLLAFTGSRIALDGTPRMIGYGMAKSAVHHLTRSLGTKDFGLSTNSIAVAVLPMILDTEANRRNMPKADFSSWTPLSFIAQTFMKWSKNEERPPNGSLVSMVTKNNITELILEDQIITRAEKEIKENPESLKLE